MHNENQLKQMAQEDVKSFGDDNTWRSRVKKDYKTFKALEGTELSSREFKVYQNECLKLLENKRASKIAKKIAKMLSADVVAKKLHLDTRVAYISAYIPGVPNKPCGQSIKNLQDGLQQVESISFKVTAKLHELTRITPRTIMFDGENCVSQEIAFNELSAEQAKELKKFADTLSVTLTLSSNFTRLLN